MPGPTDKHKLIIDAPIEQWCDAVPLGNGLTGALLWGGGRDITITLDRGDLWDLRPTDGYDSDDWNYATIRRLVAAGDHDALVAKFDTPYRKCPYPTKLPPAGRIRLRLGKAVKRFELDLRTAVARGGVEAFCSAVAPIGMARGKSVKLQLEPPNYSDDAEETFADWGPMSSMDYPPARSGRHWFDQMYGGDASYAVVVAQEKDVIAWAITTSAESGDCAALARERVAAALDAGFDKMLKAHTRWWRRFWSQSSIDVPDETIERHYYLVNYYLGSGSRKGAPPMPLQGVWTADNGRMPAWKGDYHHDLNTQMNYWSYHTAGHFDEGASFVDHLSDLLPTFERFARSFYDCPGAAVPGTMSLDGQPHGGWNMYAFAPTIGAWLAQHFDLHWRYTMDREFLADKAYPFCSAMGVFLDALIDKDGKLPLSSSPEVHDNRLEAYMTPNTNHDLSLMRWLFTSLQQMAATLGKSKDAARWRRVFDRLDDFAVETPSNQDAADADWLPTSGGLMLSPDEALTESHRHFAHLMPIYPLGLLHMEGDERDRRIIHQSIATLDLLGSGQWICFSYVWMACLAARCGMPQRALHNLRCFIDGFTSRNGFNVNGDIHDMGLCAFKGAVVTLETNFGAAQAVHEMLLQSWGGKLRVFPALPDRWAGASFNDLRAEGGFKVSAKRKGGRTVRVKIAATVDGELVLRDPFDGAKVTWRGKRMRRRGDDYVRQMKTGDVIEAAI